tara:strand:- start:195 stop:416 length:222 start_codon:yes stop_codon:yes gene_type:complete
MPTDKKLLKFDKFDKELLNDAFKALDVFSEQGWDEGFEFLEEAKRKKGKKKRNRRVLRTIQTHQTKRIRPQRK